MSGTTPGSTSERLRVKLEGLVAECVDRPETVRVEVNEGLDREQLPSLFFRIHTLPTDRGRVIGSAGKTMSHLRSLFGAIGARLKLRIYMEVADSFAPRA